MKRTVFAGLLFSLVASTAAAQLQSNGRKDQPTDPSASPPVARLITPSSEIQLIEAENPEKLAAIAEPAQTEEKHDIAGCQHCKKDWTQCHCGGRGWTAYGEWLLLHPRGADPVFATRALNCSSPPIGVEQIDFGAESGFKVGIAKLLCDGCSEIGASFTHFEANDSRKAVAGPGTILRPAITVPLPPTCDDATSFNANGDATISFERVEIDYKRYMDIGCIHADWLVGFAYGQLNMDLKGVFDTTTVMVNSDSFGYGLKLGGGGEYGHGCVRGYGHVDLSLLASNAKAHFKQVDAVGVTGVVANFEQGFDRIIPILDLEAGVAWDMTHHMTLKAGYTYSFWFNVVTVPEFIDSVQHGDVSGNNGDTLTFDGVFVRLEVNW